MAEQPSGESGCNQADRSRAFAAYAQREQALRSEVEQLRQKLADAQSDLDEQRVIELREANAELVLSALQAERLIESVMKEHRGIAGVPHAAQIEALREANERLLIAVLASKEHDDRQEANQIRERKFVAMVAHELRDPLNPMRMVAEMLERAVGDKASLAKLQIIIETQVASMAKLIDDLLDRTQAGIGTFRLACSVIDLNTVLQSAIEITASSIEKRGQQLLMQLSNEQIHVNADFVRLSQVFSNLIGNSSKYTRQGGRISVSTKLDDDFVVVTVADNGIGIAADVLPHVFEMFVQDDRALFVNHAGFGIGLAVVRELVEAHGGTVAASSAGKNLGTEFNVRLPVFRSVN